MFISSRIQEGIADYIPSLDQGLAVLTNSTGNGGLMLEKLCKIQNSIRGVGGCLLYMKQSVKFNHLIFYLLSWWLGVIF